VHLLEAPRGDPDLVDTFQSRYIPLCPNRPEYLCLPRISNILLDLHNQLLTNIKNHVAVHFEARHRCLMRLLLRDHAWTVPFFEATKEDLDSCTRILTTAILWRPDERVEELLPEYPRLYGLIPLAAVRKLQEIVDGVRLMVGPLPASPESGAHAYLPWMHFIGEELTRRGLRSFSLFPHAPFAAPSIAITPTTWPELEPRTGKRKLLGGLRDAFPSLERLETGGKKFADRITTDGVAANVHFLVDKRPGPKEDRQVHIHPKQRVVGLDPGKSPDFLTGAILGGEWDGTSGQEEMLNLRTREFYHRAGFKKRTSLMCQWMSRDVDVSAFNRDAPSADCGHGSVRRAGDLRSREPIPARPLPYGPEGEDDAEAGRDPEAEGGGSSVCNDHWRAEDGGGIWLSQRGRWEGQGSSVWAV
jgi:hypothetical protein